MQTLNKITKMTKKLLTREEKKLEPQIIHIKKDEENILNLPHPTNEKELIIIHVEEGAKVTINRFGKNSGTKTQHLSLIAEKNSHIEYRSLHQGEDSSQVTSEQFFLRDNVSLNIAMASLKQQNGHHAIHVNALGNNTESIIQTAFEVGEHQNQTVKVHATFIGKNSTGTIKMNGVLEDKAKAEVVGKIRILKDANGTDSNLSEKIITLGDKAICNAKPIIAIDTDDVKAGHGASISRINDEDLFYFQCRGIHKKEAHAILKQGFLISPFEGLDPEEPFMKELQTSLEKQS